jgi:hypothetical protein
MRVAHPSIGARAVKAPPARIAPAAGRRRAGAPARAARPRPIQPPAATQASSVAITIGTRVLRVRPGGGDAGIYVAGADAPLGAALVLGLLKAGRTVVAGGWCESKGVAAGHNRDAPTAPSLSSPGVANADAAAADLAILSRLEVVKRKDKNRLTVTQEAPSAGAAAVVLPAGVPPRTARALLAALPPTTRVLIVGGAREAGALAAAAAAAGARPCVAWLPPLDSAAAGPHGALPAAAGPPGSAPPAGASISLAQAAAGVAAALQCAPAGAVFELDLWARTAVPLVPTPAAVASAMSACIVEVEEREEGAAAAPTTGVFGTRVIAAAPPSAPAAAAVDPSPMLALLGGLRRGVLYSESEDSSDDDTALPPPPPRAGPLAWLSAPAKVAAAPQAPPAPRVKARPAPVPRRPARAARPPADAPAPAGWSLFGRTSEAEAAPTKAAGRQTRAPARGRGAPPARGRGAPPPPRPAPKKGLFDGLFSQTAADDDE